MSTVGVAQVIAFLKSPESTPVVTPSNAGGVPLETAVADSPDLEGLETCFECSELSHNNALARAGLQNVASKRGTRRAARSPRSKAPPAVLHFPNLGLVLGTVTRDGLSALRNDKRVSQVTAAPQPRLIRPVRVAAAKLNTTTTWGIEFLDVPKLWKQGLTGKGVRVGHLDTGADGKHPALKAAIESFAEFNSFGVQVKPAPKPYDTEEHGTHTAATIAGRAVKGRSVGVAPGVEICSAIVIDGGNVIARILGGMDWAVSQNVRILNMSIGIPFSPPLPEFNTILRILRARKVLPIVAVGNEGPGTSRAPGNHPGPISVGAVDKNKLIPDFSSSQQFERTANPMVPDIVAPGADVISAQPGGKFQAMDGSSMATPHVSGLAALLFEAVPAATISDVENAIYSSCTRGAIPVDRGNRGFPNAVRALAALTGTHVGGKVSTPRRAPSKSSAIARKPARRSISKSKPAKKRR